MFVRETADEEDCGRRNDLKGRQSGLKVEVAESHGLGKRDEGGKSVSNPLDFTK